MAELGYSDIALDRLNETINKDGFVKLRLKNKRGRVCLALLDKLSETDRFNKNKHSIFSRIIFLISGLFLNLRVLIFHSSFFELMIFMNQNKMNFRKENIDSENILLTFEYKELNGHPT